MNENYDQSTKCSCKPIEEMTMSEKLDDTIKHIYETKECLERLIQFIWGENPIENNKPAECVVGLDSAITYVNDLAVRTCNLARTVDSRIK